MARPKPLPKDDALDYGLWWVSRWISGSMRDPDWSWPEAETLTDAEAFAVVRDRIGVARAAQGPFWRYLDLPGAEAERILAGGDLLPHRRSRFQSFTTSRALAEDFGEDGRNDMTGVVVRVEVPAELVMFGFRDLKADRRAAVTLLPLDHWHHQDEIVVLVDGPLKVAEAYRSGPAPRAAPAEPDGEEDPDLDMGPSPGF